MLLDFPTRELPFQVCKRAYHAAVPICQNTCVSILAVVQGLGLFYLADFYLS